MRHFNTEGPVVAEDHYRIPPLERIDLDQVLDLVRAKKYFILHAPRQTGKTSTLLALHDLLNGGEAGDYRCVYANIEAAQAAREDVRRAMQAILTELELRAQDLGDDALATWPAVLDRVGPDGVLRSVLTRWAQADPRPLVLLVDEVDTLMGDSLIAVLRQLRAGYDLRPTGFPQSVILCGVRDVRDYRIRSTAEGAMVLGGSAFNIKAESLRLGDFIESEVRALIAQHTAETGQAFTGEALEAVQVQTCGQPWLVNALCRDACFRDPGGRDRSRAITAEAIGDARERLIQRRETHLDQLAHKLEEERVRRVIEPILTGSGDDASSPGDEAYVRDLGLIARDTPLRIANPIYAEVVPRELTHHVQQRLPQDAAWYVDGAGGLDMDALLTAFQGFFREHSEHWVERFRYREAGPQLLLQAFLQRVVNSGGRIEREYALGRGRLDLLIIWPRGGSAGPGAAPSVAAALDAGVSSAAADGEGDDDGVRSPPAGARPVRDAAPAPDAVSRDVSTGGAAARPAPERIVVECKILHGSLERTVAEGVAQTAAYMDRCAAGTGHLVIFDRDADKTWADRIFRRPAPGRPVTVWGM